MLPSVIPHASASVGNCSDTLNCSSSSNILSLVMGIENLDEVEDREMSNGWFLDE